MAITYKTPFTEKVGVEYPIIMGSFAGLAKADFAAPVSEAGALGIITAHNFKTVDAFKANLEKMESLTSKPYGINFTIRPPIENFRMFLSEDDFMPYVEAALEFGIKTMTTSAYKAKKIGDRLHEAGCTWIHKCATLTHAISADNHGADFVVVVGLEGTGFKNPMQNTTLIHMTTANKILKTNTIAAGGISDARGFLSCLMMGASAVCFGTLLMATDECPSSYNYKQKQIVNQRGFDDEKFYKGVFRHSLSDSASASMAVTLINDIVPVKERIGMLIRKADEILKQWGISEKLDLT
ncbi:MAG: nitronate monooxygenase [Promethearchaeota archaeon]